MAPLPDVALLFTEPIVNRQRLRSGVIDAGNPEQTEGEWRRL
jgi:hypothetical protein